MAEMAAAAGIVKIQAQTIFKVTPQRTAESLRTDPTPEIAPVMTWVVLTGTPKYVEVKMLTALAVSAQKPSMGCSFVILLPIVLTILQPPLKVPNAIAVYALKTTHNGTVKFLINPPTNSKLVIMPMVFCASLPPCPKLKSAADNN